MWELTSGFLMEQFSIKMMLEVALTCLEKLQQNKFAGEQKEDYMKYCYLVKFWKKKRLK